MRILVTGGAGFVGSVCCAELLKQGHSVTVVDDLSAGHASAIPSGVSFYKCNIGDTRSIANVLQEKPADAVFHFAAKASIPESMSNPGIFFDQNVAAGIAFLEVLRKAGVSRFVFSSSAAVYGSPEQVPISEDHKKAPVNSYGETKLMLERALEWYASAYEWTVVSFRYFNACGATNELGEDHRPETHIIPLVLQTAAQERDYFQIHGTDYPTPDGTCLRDYVHVQDIARAHLLALKAKSGATAYNIGTGKSYSVREICRAVEEVTGKAVCVRDGPRRSGDPAILCASPAKLQQELGWRPEDSELPNILRSAWLWKQRNPQGYSHSEPALASAR